MTISLSVRARPLASYRGQSTHGINTHKFHGSFRSCFFYLHSLFHMLTSKKTAYWRTCHTATLTNFLCYTLISQIQGKSAYLRFPASLWSLTPSSHHRIILALQASILRRPQGFCIWLLYDDTLQGIVDDVRLRRQNHFCWKESANPVSRINLSHCHRISAGLKNPSSLS